MFTEWTGLDVDRTYREIENFNDSSSTAARKLREMYDHFFAGIENDWASPNAVAFSKDAIGKVTDLYHKFVQSKDRIISTTVESAIILADANGSTFNRNIEVSRSDLNMEYYKGCQETNNGVTGMKIREIEFRRDNLLSETKVVMSVLGDLPTQISFYDVKGSLINAYQTNIRVFANSVEELNNQIVKEIDINIQNEQYALQKASNEAEQLLKELPSEQNDTTISSVSSISSPSIQADDSSFSLKESSSSSNNTKWTDPSLLVSTIPKQIAGIDIPAEFVKVKDGKHMLTRLVDGNEVPVKEFTVPADRVFEPGNYSLKDYFSRKV